jgi:hypothetical protein
MALSSHLEAVLNGMFLVLLGLLWPHIDLPKAWGGITARRCPWLYAPLGGRQWRPQRLRRKRLAALGADDRLTLVEDHHVADMEQRDFDALVEGLEASRWRDGDAYNPRGAVAQHAAWTTAIRAEIG